MEDAAAQSGPRRSVALPEGGAERRSVTMPSQSNLDPERALSRQSSTLRKARKRSLFALAEGDDTDTSEIVHDRFGCHSCIVVPNAVARRALSGRRYDGRAFFVLGVRHPLRRRVINLVESEWWDRVVLLVVLANCVTTAIKDPLSPEAPAWYALTEWVFTIIFTAEMALKMAAMGATPLESTVCYLSEGWNCLDFVIVMSSWISQLLVDGSISFLRTFRVLRPLRTISRIRGMRILVRSLISSLPQLRDVLLLFRCAPAPPRPVPAAACARPRPCPRPPRPAPVRRRPPCSAAAASSSAAAARDPCAPRAAPRPVLRARGRRARA